MAENSCLHVARNTLYLFKFQPHPGQISLPTDQMHVQYSSRPSGFTSFEPFHTFFFALSSVLHAPFFIFLLAVSKLVCQNLV